MSIFTRLFYRGPSVDALHETYAKEGRIDPHAPVQASASVEIQRPVEQDDGTSRRVTLWIARFGQRMITGRYRPSAAGGTPGQKPPDRRKSPPLMPPAGPASC